MEKSAIPVCDLNIVPFSTFAPGGVLLVCGRGVEQANPMTISWGMAGIMWSRPVMMVMVRPSRRTFAYLHEAPDFTVNWMAEDWSDALRLCGSASGRDLCKFTATGMTPVAATQVRSPAIDESILTLECRVIYRDDVTPAHFRDAALAEQYAREDAHGLFYGEIVAARGIPRFRR